MTEERKLVTVLFADIVGSTALGMEHDPEVVRAALMRTFDAARAVLETHGATVEKFIGDAVMAVFGVPAAHDDDAERAVRAAFALHARVAELARDRPLGFALRVGVNTGEAVTGSGGGDQFLVTGPVVNVAARLQQAAQPGEILVGPFTQAMTKGGIGYGPPREIEAKGVGRLSAWPALELHSGVPEQHRGLPGLHAPLIGRGRELDALQNAYARVLAEGAPSLVTVYGPPGAGKTRLTTEFAAAVGTDKVRTGRCLPYGEAITFYPVQLILWADAGIRPTDDHITARAKLDAAVAGAFLDEAERDGVAARLAVIASLARPADALPEIGDAELPDELRWGVRRYIERRASAAPLVLVFEDVHWAEPALLDLIEHLAEWTRAPLLVVCLARPEFRDLRPNWGANVPNAAAIALTPLRPEDTRQLIAELLAIDALSETVRQEVVTRAEGNPLYVEEFLRMLMESGRIAHEGGRWVARGSIETLEVPPSLQGIITARLDRADPEVKRLLQSGSVVGRLFSTSAIEAIGGAEPPPTALRDAVRRDLLVEADERAPGTGRVYRFKHVLMRDVAYGTLPKADRARLHDNYGRWLESAFGDRATEIGDIVGYHAEQAFLYAQELGADDAPVLGSRALDLLLEAASRARLRIDPHAAWRLYARAAAVASGFDCDLSRRIDAVTNAISFSSGFETHGPDWTARCADALALAEQGGPNAGLVRMLITSAWARYNDAADTAGALALADRAVDVARSLPDSEPRIVALLDRAQLEYFAVGDPRVEERLLDEATGIARASHTPLLLRALGSRHLIAFLALDLTASAAIRREWESLLPPEPSKLLRFRQAQFAGWDASEAGDLDLAVGQLEVAVGHAREAGVPNAIASGLWLLGAALLEAGEVERARLALEESAVLFERLNARGQSPEAHGLLARIAVRQGDPERARRHLALAEQQRNPKDQEVMQLLGVARGELAVAAGDDPTADQEFRWSIEVADGHRSKPHQARARIAYAEFLLSRGRPAEAKIQLEPALALYADPLAARRREQIGALIARAGATVS